MRVGLLTLAGDLRIRTADATAIELLGGTRATVVGAALRSFFLASDEDSPDLKPPWPLSWSGVSATTSARCLVQVSEVPADASGTLQASIISINEYLAESESNARVQLRSTIESIIAGFAHEVRNPLAAILSLTEAALQADPSPDSVLVRIPMLVQRVESLLQQSLAYSRPRSPDRELHHPSFLVEHAAGLLRPRNTAVELKFDVDADVPAVLVDLSQGEQILVNLLENALDVARSRVEVKVQRAKTSMPAVCIEISDDGPGIPEEIAGRIFNPFFTTKAHGTGLGLAIARDLSRLNGGHLHLVPVPGRGAIFRVYLPSTPTRLTGV